MTETVSVDENGMIVYRLNGVIHRDGDEPAIIYANGDRVYYVNGKLHRDGDQPAVIFSNGSVEYWFDGKLHREGDKPAIIRTSGSKMWYTHGALVDVYHPNFNCFNARSREEALERLNSKDRPYSYDLYLRDINETFPESR